MNLLRKIRRYAMNSGYVLLTMVVINSLSFGADPGKNGKIAFIANLTGTNQIYTANPDGTDLFQVTNLPPASNPFALAPDFSPDGKRIIFPYATTGALELYVINADGTNLTQITRDGMGHGLPRWSPDGSHILFATGGKHNTLVIATIRSDGTDLKMLTTPFWDSLGASYTPDGKHIVFSSQQGGLVSALWIMDTDGKHQRRLTDPELEAGPPDVASDGEQVVFYTHQDTPKPTSIFKINTELEARLLAHAEQVHTESGKHARLIETWPVWAARAGFRARAGDPVAARRLLEQRLADINKKSKGLGKLPWPSDPS